MTDATIAAVFRMAEWEAIRQLRVAIQDQGSHAAHHRAVMAKHRREWPTLWEAIDRLLGVAVGCTSATRPGNPLPGTLIEEHDTGYYYQWSGTSWELLAQQ